MFSRLMPKPRPPSPSLKSELRTCFGQFIEHMELLNRHFDQANVPLANLDPLNPELYQVMRDGFASQEFEYKAASLEAQKVKELVLQAQSIWPDGRKAFAELLKGIACVTSLIANLQEANTLAAGDDRLNPTKMTRVRQLLRSNREHGSSADKHFKKGLALLTERGVID